MARRVAGSCGLGQDTGIRELLSGVSGGQAETGQIAAALPGAQNAPCAASPSSAAPDTFLTFGKVHFISWPQQLWCSFLALESTADGFCSGKAGG